MRRDVQDNVLVRIVERKREQTKGHANEVELMLIWSPERVHEEEVFPCLCVVCFSECGCEVCVEEAIGTNALGRTGQRTARVEE